MTRYIFLLPMVLITPLQYLVAQGKSSNASITLGTHINSIWEEMNPVLAPDGNTLYFCRGRHPENIGGTKDKGDIWFSVKDVNGNWQKAQNLGAPINNTHKNDLIGISDDGNTMFLHYDYGQDGRSLNQGISYSRKTASGWSLPEKIQIPYFYNASEHQSACLSKDGNVIIFSIESYGTFGAEDLYVSFRQPSGTWTEPVNLGSQVNTSQQEMTPFLARDNKTLFFVSNGRKGIGSKDIYKTVRLDNTWKNWSEVENLGPLMNTEGMEMYYHQDDKGELAFIVSTQNSDGYGDIHQIKIRNEDIPGDPAEEMYLPVNVVAINESDDSMFQVPDTVIVFKLEPDITDEDSEDAHHQVFKGKVLNAVSKTGIAASMEIRNEYDIKSANSDGETGNFNVIINESGTYKISISAKGFMTKEEFIEVEDAMEDLDFKFFLIPLEVGTTIQLSDVLFEQGTANILENSFGQLDKVVSMMIENPNLIIELAGHTDNQGVAKLNIKLSQERVEQVKKYLVQKGIESFRISGKGYGGLKPIASNKNEETRKLNRRVEFTIVKN